MHLTDLISRTGVKNAAGRLWTAPLVDAAIGGAISAVVAFGTSVLASGHSWKAQVPLVFIVVLLAVAGIFGTRAGILGTVLAALVFSTFLFGPVGNISVASDSARNNLGWMLLIGIAFSFLFAPQDSGLRRH